LKEHLKGVRVYIKDFSRKHVKPYQEKQKVHQISQISLIFNSQIKKKKSIWLENVEDNILWESIQHS